MHMELQQVGEAKVSHIARVVFGRRLYILLSYACLVIAANLSISAVVSAQQTELSRNNQEQEIRTELQRIIEQVPDQAEAARRALNALNHHLPPLQAGRLEIARNATLGGL